MIFTMKDEMKTITVITEEREHFKALPKCDHFSAIASHVKQLVTASNGTVLTFWQI